MRKLLRTPNIDSRLAFVRDMCEKIWGIRRRRRDRESAMKEDQKGGQKLKLRRSVKMAWPNIN